MENCLAQPPNCTVLKYSCDVGKVPGSQNKRSTRQQVRQCTGRESHFVSLVKQRAPPATVCRFLKTAYTKHVFRKCKLWTFYYSCCDNCTVVFRKHFRVSPGLLPPFPSLSSSVPHALPFPPLCSSKSLHPGFVVETLSLPLSSCLLLLPPHPFTSFSLLLPSPPFHSPEKSSHPGFGARRRENLIAPPARYFTACSEI